MFDRLDPEEIKNFEASKHDSETRERLEHLHIEKERVQSPNATSNEEYHASSSSPSHLSANTHKTHGPTPYLRQRLPEAIEAERRRNESIGHADEEKENQ